MDLRDQIPAGKSRVVLNEVLETQLKSNKDRQQNHPDYLIEQKKQKVALKSSFLNGVIPTSLGTNQKIKPI
jgi:hypothetical protein